MSLVLWIAGIIYLLISGVVTFLLVGDGKPVWAALIAGLLWAPLLIYGLLANAFMTR